MTKNLSQKCITTIVFILYRELEALFGKKFWDNVILEFTHWAFDTNSVMKRNQTGTKHDHKYQTN